MKKIIIRNTTRTVWSQETKQTDFELDNGIKVSVRQMEDDNQVQTFFFKCNTFMTLRQQRILIIISKGYQRET